MLNPIVQEYEPEQPNHEIHQEICEHTIASVVNDGDDHKKKKKKKTRFFEHHIRKILNEISTDRDITHQAKTQLNDIAIITCKKINQKLVCILTANHKRTITCKEIESAIYLLFTGQLSQQLIEEGRKCVQQYVDNTKNKTLKGQLRNVKAEILIPPSILERLLRETGFQLSFTAPIFLAGVIEYFLAQIIQLAVILPNTKQIRITSQHLEEGIQTDPELSNYMTSQQIYLFQTRIIPYIHPDIKQRTGKNDKKSIKMMTKIQESNNYIFPKRFFEKMCKQLIMLIHSDIRFQKGCFMYLQDYIEKWLIELLQYTNIFTLYAKKSRVTANDIELIVSMMEKRLPSFLLETKMENDVEDLTHIFESRI